MAVPIPDRVECAALIARLADGEVHSGAALGRELGASRGRLRGAVQRLKALGVEIGSLRGRGYRLPGPVELLDAARIREALGREHGASVRRLEVLLEVDSTNSRLLAAPPPPSALSVGSAAQERGASSEVRRTIKIRRSGCYIGADWLT
jgi:BirA family biotin operon repressor/biotin-[acetyl-CoA-carboxylase] ligase